jgi:uncharacterized membrane protein YfcA
MLAINAIILLVTGIVVGFASGLLGIGGGFIMNPVQLFVFTNVGITEDTAIKMAFGTGLLVMLPTAISGAWRHHRKGAVHWKAALIMGSCSSIMAIVGSTIATHLPGTYLKMAFGVVAVAGAIWMLTGRLPQAVGEPRTNPFLLLACAIPIGLLAGTIGLGGGVLAVPIMTLALKFKMHNAVATSLAMMILTSIGGVIGYFINGIGVPGRPPYSIGYVNLPSFLLLVVTSMSMAQIGAITAHRLPAKELRYIFIALILYIGLKMLGLFDWLGWPL